MSEALHHDRCCISLVTSSHLNIGKIISELRQNLTLEVVLVVEVEREIYNCCDACD